MATRVIGCDHPELSEDNAAALRGTAKSVPQGGDCRLLRSWRRQAAEGAAVGVKRDSRLAAQLPGVSSDQD